MRRVPEPGIWNSAGSRPILSIMHCIGSTFPVAMAILGMSAVLFQPSNLLRGRRELAAGTAVVWQSGTVGSICKRRHLPIWTTSGIWLLGAFAVVGTLTSVNC